MKVIVQEVIKDETGRCVGVGNTYEVEKQEAESLVSSGEYKFEGVPIGAKEAKKSQGKKKVEPEAVEQKAEEIENVDNT